MHEHGGVLGCEDRVGGDAREISMDFSSPAEDKANRVTMMQGCNQVQCLARKRGGWRPETDDEDFELDAKICFLTGVSTSPPNEWEVEEFQPVRHGVNGAVICNAFEPVLRLPRTLKVSQS